MANGQRDKEWAGEVILKGPVDVTLHHYGACDIYREFGDAVYDTILATDVCKMQMTTLASRIATRITARRN